MLPLRIRYSMFVSLVVIVSCQTVPKPDRTAMTMGFAEAVYGLGIEPEGRHTVIRQDKLMRWNSSKAVNLIVLDEPVDSPLYKRIVSELQELYQQASLTLSPGLETTDQLLRVTISDDTLLVTEEIKTNCYTKYQRVNDGYLKTVYIVATRNILNDDTMNCLLHEGMHSLGFSGHPHRLNSVLSYTHDQSILSDIDRQLIDMLYHDGLEPAATLDESLTFAYNQFASFREQRAKRYIPRDISLELTQDESPLVLEAPSLAKSSHQYYYKASKDGTQTIDAIYGARGSGRQFANIVHTTLSSHHIFKKQPGLDELVEPYEPYLGRVTVRSEGHAEHALGRFKYAIVDTPGFSCVFTIKFINANDIDIGGHEMLYGYFCDDIQNSLNHTDAAEFIQAIHVFDRDPVLLREQRMISRETSDKDFLAIRLTGKWPLDDSYISGLKLISRSKTAGKMLIKISDETCNGRLFEIEASGLGEWELVCNQNEGASGQFSWEADGTLRFRGETAVTRNKINWTAYQVF